MDHSQNLQFLNLDEIDRSEAELVQTLLYASKSPKLELPWVVQEEQEWNQQQQFDGEAEVYDGGGTGEVYHQMQVPVATTLPQIFHHTQVIPPMAYMGNIHHQTPNIGYGIPAPMATYHPSTIFQDGRRPRAAKPSPKRNREGSYQPVNPTPPFPTQFTIPVPYPYIQPSPAHITTAQHATGHPLYMTGAIPLYHSPYNYHPTVYSQIQAPPQVPPEEVKFEKEPQFEKEEPLKEEKPVKSLPLNAIKTTSLQSMPSKRRNEEVQPPQQPPPPPQAPPAQAPPSTKSWAQVTANKIADVEHLPVQAKNTFKPSVNAVVLSSPPRYEIKNQHNSDYTQEDDVEPHLRQLGEFLSNYSLDHKSVVLTPRGLKNPSNYCYINAILQALLACPAFYNLIKVISDVKQAVHKFPSIDRQDNPLKSKTPIIDSMIQFIKEFSQAPVSKLGKREKAQARKDKEENYEMPPLGMPFEPSYIYKMLRALRSEASFHEEGRQEDAEEFLSLLLNKLNDEMLELQKLFQDPKSQPVVNGDLTSNGDTHNEDDAVWKEVTTKGNRVTRRAELERTPLSDIFRGQLRSSLHRPEPSSSSDNVQPFFTLQLDIETSETVSEALEKLVGRCPVEGASQDCAVTQSLDQLPCVLILHLKCFHYREQTPSKIIKALEFPVDLKLDQKLLSSKTPSSVKARQYKLFAVVYHDGKEATKGHYLTDVFYLGGGAPGWIRYDDASVNPVSESAVLHPKAPRVPYLLYYRRADTIGTQQHNLVPKS